MKGKEEAADKVKAASPEKAKDAEEGEAEPLPEKVLFLKWPEFVHTLPFYRGILADSVLAPESFLMILLSVGDSGHDEVTEVKETSSKGPVISICERINALMT